MKIHDLIQGTPEWHAHRATHFNASDAPAMMGVSPYKTRNELLRELHSGIAKEVDASTQRRFDYGHRFEDLARNIAEKIIGAELFPVTGSEGKYSASFDGLTMMEDIAFEHKSLNDEIRACESISELPEMYKFQMEQQCLVSGCDKVLFLATKWDNKNELIEQKYFWYEPDGFIRKRLMDGWTQFEKDLENYQPVEVKEAPKAEVSIQLPSLFVHAKGEITTSNMKEYGEALALRLKEVRAIALVDDQDFANAKEAAKLFREQIQKLKLAKESMLAQTLTIGEASRMIDAWAEDLRVTALQLEKDVEREDLAKKNAMVNEARLALKSHIEALEGETKPIKLNVIAPDFAGAIKGKRNYASMQESVDTALRNGKFDADTIAEDIRGKLEWMIKDHGIIFSENAFSGLGFLFRDLQQIIYKPMDDFKLLVTTRIAEHEMAEDARIKAEAERLAAQQSKSEPVATNAQSEDAPHKLVTGDGGAAPLNPAPVDNQDVISAFMSNRNFGKDTNRIRAVLVEFVKFQEGFRIKA